METVGFLRLGKVGELESGAMKRVLVQDREILLARVGDKFYAADNRCPHMGGDLSRGTLKGTIVTCPRHASQFDLADGRIIRWTNWSGVLLKIARIFRPPRPLNVYPVKIEGDTIVLVVKK